MCNACKPTNRFHDEPMAYAAPQGELSENAQSDIFKYLLDLQRSTQYTLPSLKLWSNTAYAHASYANWVESESYAYAHEPFREQLPEVFNSLRSMSRQGLPTLIAGATPEQRKNNAATYTKQLYRWVSDRTQSPIPSHVSISALLTTVGSQWLIAGNGDNVGTFPKRVAKLLWKEANHKLTPQQLETLGNIASAGVSRDKSHMLTFDQGYTEGTDEEYGNDGSCWWKSEREGIREAFQEAGGYAIREWNADDEVTSRCFIIWDSEHKVYIAFNAYGDLSLAAFARLLSLKWGMTYTQINLRNQGSYSGKLYINNGNGIAIGSPDIVSSLEGTTIDLDIEEPCSCSCCQCDCSLDEDDAIHDDDGNPYCSDCYSETYESCDNCGNTFCRDDSELHACDGNSYCERCARRMGYAECDNCDTWSDSLESCPDGECCDECCEQYTRCDECETLCEPGDMTTTTDGDCHCPDCYEEPEPEPEVTPASPGYARMVPYHLTWGSGHGCLMARID